VAVLAAQDARQAPVHHVDLAEVPDHHVGGLEVAVDHAFAVRVGHPLARAQDHRQRARLVPAFLAGEHEVEHVLEVAALHELHREVDAAVAVQAQLVHRDDAGVVELAGHLRLFEEARELVRLDLWRAAARGRLALAEDHLHREMAAQIAVPHAQDRAHAAARDLALELVARGREALLAETAHELAGGRDRRLAGRRVERDLRVDAGAKASLEPFAEGRRLVGLRAGRARLGRGHRRRARGGRSPASIAVPVAECAGGPRTDRARTSGRPQLRGTVGSHGR